MGDNMDKSMLKMVYQQPAPNILADVCAKAAKMNDVIDLSVGDPNFTTPEPIIDYAFTKAKAGMTHYTGANGLPELRQAIAKFYQDQFGLTYDPDQVLVTTGAQHGMYLAMQVLLNPGDEVIIPQPSYSPYVNQVKMAGGVPVLVANDPAKDFAIDFDALTNKITDKTKAIIVNTPNNPTGHLMAEGEIKKLVQLAIDHDLLVFSDEIYSDYVMPGHTFTTLAKYAPDNVVVNSGMSKCFAMTGWRIGYLIGPKWLVDAANEANDAITYVAPTMGQEGALYGLQHHDQLVAPLSKAFQERLTYLYDRLKELDWLKLQPAEGAIYLFADITATGFNSVDFADQLLNKAGILVVPGLAFGKAGEGFIRIAATQEISVLKQAVAKLQQLKW